MKTLTKKYEGQIKKNFKDWKSPIFNSKWKAGNYDDTLVPLYSPKNLREKKDRQLRWGYGIGIDDFISLWIKQDKGKCAICGVQLKIEWNGNRSGIAVVDHDHETGKVRGLLCAGCNSGLGFYEKVKKIGIKKIERYLEEGSEP